MEATPRKAVVFRNEDPIAKYMSSIRSYPLLEREEEQALARQYKVSRDPALANRLVGAHLRLVVKIAGEYHAAAQNLLDLIQEGNLGLVKSLEHYDAERGIRLSTYAAWWIRAYILKHILDNARLVRLGTTEAQRKLFFNLRREQSRLEARGIKPTPQRIAKALNVPVSDVESMEQRLASHETSIDAPSKSEEPDARTPADRLEAPEWWRPDLEAERAEEAAHLHRALADFKQSLKGRDQTIFNERLLADDPATLQMLADKFGISRERTRQIEKRLLRRIKEALADTPVAAAA